MTARSALGSVANWVATIGDSDCELLRDGTLVQPTNALSSLAYVAIGAVAVAWSMRLRARRAEAVLYGVLLIAVGLGSVLFHGPQPDGSKSWHDLPILLAGLLMLIHDLALLRPSLRTLPAFAGAGAMAAAVGLAAPAIVPALTALVLVGVVAAEFAVHRRGARPVAPRLALRSYLAMAAVGAAGGLSYVLGRTGGPLCDPDSVAQPHGLWHLLSGVVFGMWWWLAYAAGDRR